MLQECNYFICQPPNLEDLVSLYQSLNWGHYRYPELLMTAYENSDYVVSAYTEGGELVGIGRAITDKAFTVYFPDILVHPEWQGKGIGSTIMKMMLEKFNGYHNQILVAEDERAKAFYKKCGFAVEANALSIMRPFGEIEPF